LSTHSVGSVLINAPVSTIGVVPDLWEQHAGSSKC
jgi:hypothetical protein